MSVAAKTKKRTTRTRKGKKSRTGRRTAVRNKADTTVYADCSIENGLLVDLAPGVRLTITPTGTTRELCLKVGEKMLTIQGITGMQGVLYGSC